MVRHAQTGQPIPERVDLESMGEKLGELPDPRVTPARGRVSGGGLYFGGGGALGPFIQEGRIEAPHHGGAASRWNDDVTTLSQNVARVSRQLGGSSYLPGVEGGLATARLRFGEGYLDPQRPEESNRVGRGFGKVDVHQTGDEQGDLHGGKLGEHHDGLPAHGLTGVRAARTSSD
jgi:hypothetical protein